MIFLELLVALLRVDFARVDDQVRQDQTFLESLDVL